MRGSSTAKVFLSAVILIVVVTVGIFQSHPAFSQNKISGADVAAYQLGISAKAKPGAQLTYVITVTNYGPDVVKSFYVIDGWTINSNGITGFTTPVSDPGFGTFNLKGTWQQNRKDQILVAWLLNGDLNPGDTFQFNWKVNINPAYSGALINWARIESNGIPDGAWQTRGQTTITPPAITNVPDPDETNNRTLDGVTDVTPTLDGPGTDLAVYQAGLLNQIKAGNPLQSSWLVANFGPQSVSKFYIVAGWTLGPNKTSLLVPGGDDPNFGQFKVLGRWRQINKDEERWMWLLEGQFDSGGSTIFTWTRSLIPTYRGDMINWVRIFANKIPDGEWIARGDQTPPPAALANAADTNPDNDRAADILTTITN